MSEQDEGIPMSLRKVQGGAIMLGDLLEMIEMKKEEPERDGHRLTTAIARLIEALEDRSEIPYGAVYQVAADEDVSGDTVLSVMILLKVFGIVQFAPNDPDEFAETHPIDREVRIGPNFAAVLEHYNAEMTEIDSESDEEAKRRAPIDHMMSGGGGPARS